MSNEQHTLTNKNKNDLTLILIVIFHIFDIQLLTTYLFFSVCTSEFEKFLFGEYNLTLPFDQ